MRIPNDGVFFFECLKSFQQNSVFDSRMDFLWILRQGAKVCACSAKVKFPNAFKILKVRMHGSKEINARQIQKIKFYIYCRNSIIPSTN
jgi:hypothetical protein